MMDEVLQQIEEIRNQLNVIENNYRQHRHTGTDTQSVDFTDLSITPADPIANPTGGTFQGGDIDQPARDAINSILTTLRNFGLIRQ